MYRVPSNSRHVGADSPSIALERGNYRLRAPSNTKPSAPPRLRPSKKQAQKNSKMATFIVFLVLACFCCFFLAYYLWTTRWDIRAVPRHQANAHLKVIAIDSNHVDVTASSPKEAFLAYLPHSGFHNQRIAFENALVLASLLNRTLIAPPIMLGEPVAYHGFDILRRYLAVSSKMDLDHCRSISSLEPTPPECFGYHEYTNLSWESLVDMEVIRRFQHVLVRQNLSDAWLELHIGEKLSHQYYFRDNSKYQYRFVDSENGKPSLHKYEDTVMIDTLKSRPEKLLHLGSLFSTSRLRLRQRAHRLTRDRIRSQMIFTQPALVTVTETIQSSIGPKYLGVHLRLGDGSFEDDSENTTHRIWKELVEVRQVLDQEHIQTLERAIWSDSNIHLDRNPAAEGRCRAPLYSRRPWNALNMPLFIATDAPMASKHPAIIPFLRTFPCTFFLSDFQEAMKTLDGLQNPVDGVMLKGFMMPFLDAMVVSRASKVVGTPGSTFSQFVEDVLWRRYYGMPILSRG